MNSSSEEKTNVLFKIFICIILFIGVVLRAAYYFSSNSIWGDEARLALNIIDRSFLELFKPLDYYQYAPYGFLLAEKLVTNIFGSGEYALRLFPFLSSILSLVLFYRLSCHFLSKPGVLIANSFFAILVSLTFYASELKQYSSDLLFTLILLLLTIKTEKKELTLLNSILYGIIGAAFIWFSHPIIFILTGAALFITFSPSRKGVNRNRVCLSVIFSFWIISLFCSSFFTLINTIESPGLINFWKQFYFPLNLFSGSGFMGLKKIYLELFRFLTLDILCGAILILGYFSLHKRESQKTFFLLLLPILLTIIASAFHVYPLFERFLLFLIPAIIILISEGIDFTRQKLWKISPVLGIVVILLFFINPAYYTKRFFVEPSSQEEIRPLIKHLKENIKNEDIIYISHSAQYTFKYYAKRYGFCDNFRINTKGESTEEDKCEGIKNYKLVLGSEPEFIKSPLQEIEKLKGNKRVWLLFAEKLDRASKNKLLAYLRNSGIRLRSITKVNASLYLYDLRS